MTIGQKLVELSGLASGSALAHLLAITQGTGTGVDRIIFASQMAVSIEDDQVSVIQRPSELSVSAAPAQMQTTQKDKPNRITARSSFARIDVFRPSIQRMVFIAPREMHVVMKALGTAATFVASKQGNSRNDGSYQFDRAYDASVVTVFKNTASVILG